MTLYEQLEQAKQWLLSLIKKMPTEQQQTEAMVRRVCVEEGMPPEQTETIVAVIWGESQMNPLAINRKNKNGSVDYGICQFNDASPIDPKHDYWIGPGKTFPTPEYV